MDNKWRSLYYVFRFETIQIMKFINFYIISSTLLAVFHVLNKFTGKFQLQTIIKQHIFFIACTHFPVQKYRNKNCIHKTLQYHLQLL